MKRAVPVVAVLLAACAVAIVAVSSSGGDTDPAPRAERHAQGPSAIQRTLTAQLRGLSGAGVVVDVASGRIVAAAGSGGRSPWRSTQAPGATLDAVLAAGALDARVATTGTVRRALASPSGGSIAAVAGLDGWSIDELMRRVGFDSHARAGDLRARVAVSRGPRMTPEGAHGVGSDAGLRAADGSALDPGTRARATTFELAQLALALASDGRRRDVGLARPGAPALQPIWSRAAGRTVRAMLAAGIAGRVPDGDRTALSVVAFSSGAWPRLALALTALSPDDDIAPLAARARRLLASAPR